MPQCLIWSCMNDLVGSSLSNHYSNNTAAIHRVVKFRRRVFGTEDVNILILVRFDGCSRCNVNSEIDAVWSYHSSDVCEVHVITTTDGLLPDLQAVAITYCCSFKSALTTVIFWQWSPTNKRLAWQIVARGRAFVVQPCLDVDKDGFRYKTYTRLSRKPVQWLRSHKDLASRIIN